MEAFLKNSRRDAFVWNLDRALYAEVMPNKVSLLDLAAVRAKEKETSYIGSDEGPMFTHYNYGMFRILSDFRTSGTPLMTTINIPYHSSFFFFFFLKCFFQQYHKDINVNIQTMNLSFTAL